jgi:hypothetical protein
MSLFVCVCVYSRVTHKKGSASRSDKKELVTRPIPFDLSGEEGGDEAWGASESDGGGGGRERSEAALKGLKAVVAERESQVRHVLCVRHTRGSCSCFVRTPEMRQYLLYFAVL